MNKFILALLGILFATQISAQNRPNPRGNRGGAPKSSIKGKISGTLIDSTSLESIPYASILLRRGTDGPQIDGTLSEDDGSFKFKDIAVGTYTIEVSYVGYNVKKVLVETSPEKPDASLGQIFMGSSAVLLEGVTVIEEAALIENKIDKIVYNAEKDAGLAGADATELLRKVPLVSVDLEGNISLRGSNNVKILINGRPSALMAESPADVLQTIPAEQIKSVEVITSPTAKYDGEGSGGIINIITKKSEIEGFSGSVGGSVGNRSNNYNLNLSAVFGRFGLNANGGGWYSWPNPTFNTYDRSDFLAEGTSTISENGEGIGSRLGYRGSASAYYDFNAYNSITTSFSLRGFNRDNESLSETIRYNVLTDITDQFSLDTETDNGRSGFEWTTDYRKKFKKPDQELAFAFQWDGSYSRTKNLFEQLDLIGNDPDINLTNLNENNGDNNEYTVQLDYTHPVGSWLKIETGAKTVLRRIESVYEGFSLDYNTDAFETVEELTDVFYYNQDVFAGYLSGTFQLSEKWSLVAGGRYELTQIENWLGKDPEVKENEYQNLLPSTILAYKLNQTSTIKLSYNQRIQRPGLRFVNPYNNQSNSNVRTIGNPFLEPEIADQIELSYSNFIKGVALNTAVYYKITNDIIEPYIDIVDGVAITNYQNIGTNRSVGLNVFASANIKRLLTLRGGINLYTYNGQGTINGVDLRNQALLASGNFSATVNLKKDFKVEGFAFFRSPRQNLQGQQTSFYMYSVGARKEFWNKRASLGIRIVQPFQEFIDFRNELVSPDFTLSSNRKIPFRSFGLSFSYKFGKLDFRDRPRRSKINDNDVKGGDDDGGQGGF